MNRRIHIHRCKYQHIAPFWNGVKCFGTWWRLYYNESDGGAVVVRDQTTELTPDNLYLLPPNLAFSTLVKNDPKQFFLHFDVDEPYDQVRAQPYTVELDDMLRKLLHKTIEEVIPPPDFLTNEGSLYATALASLTLSHIPEECIGAAQLDHRVIDAVERLWLKVGRPVNIEEEAVAQGLTKTSFIRLFKKETGQSPYAYLLQMRIQRGCELLKRSDMTIDLVAEYTGFTDRFHFSKVFKQHMGIGPGAYRRSEIT